MLRHSILSLLLLIAAASSSLAAEYNPYQMLADELAASVTNGPVQVRLGNFLYADTDQMSEFSALLRSELKVALQKTGKFLLLTAERQQELADEKKYQLSKMMEPGVRLRGLTMPVALLRGRFFYHHPEITVQAELVWLDSSREIVTKTTIPADRIAARIWPGETPTPIQLAAVIRPADFEQSHAHVQNVQQTVTNLPQDIQVRLEILGEDNYPKRDFAGGEAMHVRVTANQDCHIGVMCLSSDGSVTLLYPNAYSQNTKVRQNEPTLIPGTGRDTFRLPAQEPWGSDVILAVACTRDGDLFQLMRKTAAKAPRTTGVRGLEVKQKDFLKQIGELTRGFGVEAVTPIQWGHDEQVVSTYPLQKWPLN